MSQSPSLAGSRVDEEYRDTQWNNNGEGSSKSAKGKQKPRENSGEDRGRNSRPKSKEPTRGTPAVVDGSGRKRH
jgi:hypothetical protein